MLKEKKAELYTVRTLWPKIIQLIVTKQRNSARRLSLSRDLAYGRRREELGIEEGQRKKFVVDKLPNLFGKISEQRLVICESFY